MVWGRTHSSVPPSAARRRSVHQRDQSHETKGWSRPSGLRQEHQKSPGLQPPRYHPVHLAPVFRIRIIFSSRRNRVSSCLAPVIANAISFLWVNESFSQFACAALFFASSFFKTAGASTVRSSSSRSITTSTISPGCTPAPSRRILFTGIMCRVPHGDSDERYGYPLIVPRIGTRARAPKNVCTSTGGATAATTPASFPSILARNRNSSFAIAQSSVTHMLLDFNPTANSRQPPENHGNRSFPPPTRRRVPHRA